jgi:hypothetical protein
MTPLLPSPTLLAVNTAPGRGTNSSALIVPAPSPASTNSISATDDIRKLKPLIEISDEWLWLKIVLGVLALALVAWFAWRWWQRRRARAAFVPPVPAQDRARARLQEALALIDQPKPFCIAVSDALRQYLEERLKFRAPERTTEEFLIELRSTHLLNAEQKHSLGAFLEQCDLVKFARHEPGRPELMDLHRAALRLIQETEIIEVTAVPPMIPAAPAAVSIPPPIKDPPPLPPPPPADTAQPPKLSP